jgi:hypothetical protein
MVAANSALSVFAPDGPDGWAVCARQLAVQSASDARQRFEDASYATSLPWPSGGVWLMLHAVSI